MKPAEQITRSAHKLKRIARMLELSKEGKYPAEIARIISAESGELISNQMVGYWIDKARDGAGVSPDGRASKFRAQKKTNGKSDGYAAEFFGKPAPLPPTDINAVPDRLQRALFLLGDHARVEDMRCGNRIYWLKGQSVRVQDILREAGLA